MADRLRALWDFGDLDASEARFRDALRHESPEVGRAEVLTQLARVEGLRGRFDEGERVVEEAERLGGESAVARARVALERGRLRRSGGDPAAALPLFERAFELALEAGEDFVAVDAAHMAALAAPDRAGRDEWHARGIELAKRSVGASYWLGPLLNNLGWERYEAGEYDAALEAFERAARPRTRSRAPRRDRDRALHGREDAACPRPGGRGAAADRARGRLGAADGRAGAWFHEELGEVHLALGRAGEAEEQAALAASLRAGSERI